MKLEPGVREYPLPRTDPEAYWVGRTVHYYTPEGHVRPAVVMALAGRWLWGDPEPRLILRVLDLARGDYQVQAPFTPEEQGAPMCWAWTGH